MNRLPIDDILPQLVSAVSRNSALVLHAPPGAGKTTRVPVALLKVIGRGKIVMLEPRRLAAVSASRWMARMFGEEAGRKVGYRIRFDSKVSPETRIEVVTEGILTRRIQSDPGLEDVSLVIFDEFHERSIHADLALALCLDIQRHLRSDLKLLVMSATLDCGPVSRLLGDAPVISSAGAAYPVEERYCENIRREPLPVFTARIVRQALAETDGDILAFLPGAGEIRSCADLLREQPGPRSGISVCQLYGDMPFEEQERAIMPASSRKVVLATNVAETSLTIEGVRVVIDSGVSRRMQHDPGTGMNRLVTVRTSRASAEQRKGRAGRLASGVCYRLYGRHTFDGMTAFTPPEILVSDLSSLMLELAQWGVREPADMLWLDAPPPAAIISSRNLLRDMDAIDDAGGITAVGREMARYPLHPRMARMVIRSVELKCPQLGCDCAAILSERDIFKRGQRVQASHVSESDIDERLEALHVWRSGRGAKDPRTDTGAVRSVERVSNQLLKLTQYGGDRGSIHEGGITSAGRLLIRAYPDRIGKLREPGSDRYLLANGRGVKLSPGSSVYGRQFIVAVNADAGGAAEGTVHLAASLSEEMVRQECAGRIETRERVEWDDREGRVVALREEWLGAIQLASRQAEPGKDSVAKAICDAVRAGGAGMLAFDESARQLQGRVRLLRSQFPDDQWPDLSDETLFSSPESWLLPFAGGIRNRRELASVDLCQALQSLLDYKQSRKLEELAPTHISVPSGSRIALDYASGEVPVLAVKLQEMFGCSDTPAIAGGRVKVLVHLLSPARRPLQVTRDLKGFWNAVYPEVKKEMKGRYPKHPWPDDPWNAIPTRGLKKKHS